MLTLKLISEETERVIKGLEKSILMMLRRPLKRY